MASPAYDTPSRLVRYPADLPVELRLSQEQLDELGLAQGPDVPPGG